MTPTEQKIAEKWGATPEERRKNRRAAKKQSEAWIEKERQQDLEKERRQMLFEQNYPKTVKRERIKPVKSPAVKNKGRLDAALKKAWSEMDSRKVCPPRSRREAVRLYEYLTQALAKTTTEAGYADFIKPPPGMSGWDRPGFIYLMLNQRNGYTKIGYSKNPQVREKTLQSEDPDITLLCCAPGTIREEKELHWAYYQYGVRGEWFNLTEEQRQEIQNHLNNTLRN